MQKITVLFIFLGFYFFSFSQEIGEELYQNKKCKVYVVESGTTLYSLHKKYDVPLEEIAKLNPNTKDGLQIGQKLYIPIKDEDIAANNEQEFIIHTVQKKETLYGISRTYNLTVEDLIKMNPEAEKGINPGQELTIYLTKNKTNDLQNVDSIDHESSAIDNEHTPFQEENIQQNEKDSIPVNYKIEINDSITEHIVQKGETVYTIARRFMISIDTLIADNNIKNNKISPGQKLTIRLKRESHKKVEIKEIPRDTVPKIIKKNILINPKEDYRILIALPLNLNKNGYILSGIYDENSTLNKYTEMGVSFLMGAQMALDSLEKLGLSATVDFFDTEGNLEVLKKELEQQAKWDLVFGPFLPELIEYTANWGKENNIPVVSVTNIPTQLLENNPFLISSIPSNYTRIEGLAKYFATKQAQNNVFIVEEENDEVKNNVAYFLDKYHQAKKGETTLKRTTISGISGGSVSALIDPDKENYFIYLSNTSQRAMNFVNALNHAKNSYTTFKKSSVIMVGLNDWTQFSALNSFYKNRFELHFPSNNYLNYEAENTEKFVKNFRSKYGSDPSKYAVHGFDAVFSQTAFLLLKRENNRGYMDAFDMRSLGPEHGKENSAVFISKQKDFEIILLDIISYTNCFSK